MGRIHWSKMVAAGALAASATWAVVAAAAENIDNPTLQSNAPLAGGATVSGTITPRVGFPAHVYTASSEGLVKIAMTTENVNARDNGGVAWRPYVRVLSQSNAERNGEAWSSNGYQTGAKAEAEVVFRARPGEKFTVIATLGQHLGGGSRVNAKYTLTAKE
ncbi:MAG: hypothetical protein JST00_03725 [Deltaproteobacteria bacterium]|nr:hypothetical protein [Deltaproteobacteria bacterium]